MYFNHYDQVENLRKDTKKHYNIETYLDTNILKLLSLVMEVIKFIEKYFWIVIQYNTEYLILNDFDSLNKTLNFITSSTNDNNFKMFVSRYVSIL